MENNHRTTSRRQGGRRETAAERSRSAATRAEEHERHRRPSAGTSPHHRTKSRFPLRTVNGAVVRREGLILTSGELAGRRSRATGAAPARATAPVAPGEQSAEIVVLEVHEPESAKLSKIAGRTHFEEGLNVNREGSYAELVTQKLRCLKPDRAESQRGTRRVQSLMAASAMAGRSLVMEPVLRS